MYSGGGYHGSDEGGYGERRGEYGGRDDDSEYGRRGSGRRDDDDYGRRRFGRRDNDEGYGSQFGREEESYEQCDDRRSRPHSSIPSEADQLVKIYCAANPDYFITVKGDEVVLAPGSDDNESQQFVKDCKWGSRVQDGTGSPAFCIVHKASGLALKHGTESFDRVVLQPHDPERLDESLLWTQSDDVGNGYQCLRPVGNIHLNLDAKGGDSIRSGTELIIFEWKKQENQKWKIMPIETRDGGSHEQGQYGRPAYGDY